jgi:hypothetical protein
MKKSLMLLGVAAITLFIMSTATAVPVAHSKSIFQKPCFDQQSQILTGFKKVKLRYESQKLLNLIKIKGFRNYITSVGFANKIKSSEYQKILNSEVFSNFYNSQKTNDFLNSDTFQNFLDSDEAETFLDNYYGKNWPLSVSLYNLTMAIFWGLIIGIITWIPALALYLTLGTGNAIIGFLVILSHKGIFDAVVGSLSIFITISSLGIFWPLYVIIMLYKQAEDPDWNPPY